LINQAADFSWNQMMEQGNPPIDAPAAHRLRTLTENILSFPKSPDKAVL